MAKIKSIINAYQEKDLKSFLRFLLLKEYEYRMLKINKIKSWYKKQLFISKVTAVGHGLKIGPHEVNVQRGPKGKIVIGKDVTIWSPINITATDHIFPEGFVQIGDRTRIGSNTIIRCAKKVVIGKDCLIARSVRIYDYNGHPLNPGSYDDVKTLRNRNPIPQNEVSEIIIGNNVWIGENAFIQRGVKIGDGAVVSANSVVIKDVPEYSVVFGIPARKVLWLNVENN